MAHLQDQRTFEVWYRLPEFPGVRILGRLVPRWLQCVNHDVIYAEKIPQTVVFLVRDGLDLLFRLTIHEKSYNICNTPINEGISHG